MKRLLFVLLFLLLSCAGSSPSAQAKPKKPKPFYKAHTHPHRYYTKRYKKIMRRRGRIIIIAPENKGEQQ